MSFLIKGHAHVVEVILWLKNKEWEYDVRLSSSQPISAMYEIFIPNIEQAFIFKLKWGC